MSNKSVLYFSNKELKSETNVLKSVATDSDSLAGRMLLDLIFGPLLY